MKKICVLLGLLVALHLSAQKRDFDQRPDDRKSFALTEQGASDMNNQKGMSMSPRCDKGRQDEEGFNRERPPFDFGLQKLNDKEKEQFMSMQKELRKTTRPMENELRLRRAELDYLTRVDNPSIDQIAEKLDEVSALEKKIKLEEIKFRMKLAKVIPELEADSPRPMH
ncbi:MAG: hypothetical protein P4L28_05675 [Paludibacteraceae bacterium]|nr:hypothetical protein [Paludibacteraceae bacterium]